MAAAATSTPPESTPFLKQLVSSDRKARDAAVDALRNYLSSGRDFSSLELLKTWRGLFFCIWHSDRPQTQQALCRTLASLVSPSWSETLFLGWMRAFWSTIATNYATVDSLRLDKFLYLVRCYVKAGFGYLAAKGWEVELVKAYVEIVGGLLEEGEGRVSDGLRYHLLDTWVEEFGVVMDEEGGDEDGDVPVDVVLGIVRTVAKAGRTKVLRAHAREALQQWDERGDDDKVDQSDSG